MSAINDHAEAAGTKNGSTVVIVNVEELLAGFASTCFAVTVAVLVTVPGDEDDFTTRLIVAVAPVANTGRAHDTVAVPVHDPRDGVAETNVVPAGRMSVTTMPVAVPRPVLRTVIV